MRTTLDIDDDVLEAVKELAQVERKTAGAMLSELARRAILGGASDPGGFGEESQAAIDSDWPTFPRRPGPRRIVTSALIDRIQAELDRDDAEPKDLTEPGGAG